MGKIKFKGSYSQPTFRYASYDVEFEESSLLEFLNDDRLEGEEYTSITQIPADELEDAIAYYVYSCEAPDDERVEGTGDCDWEDVSIQSRKLIPLTAGQ